jgi:hypothetical protein
MARFSFNDVPLVGKRPPRQQSSVASGAVRKSTPSIKSTKPAKPPPFALTIDDIARTIDPEAWADPPNADDGHLATQLQHARAEIAALRDELEWLNIVPTTPEGEAQQIERERRSQSYHRFGVAAHDPTIPDSAVQQRRMVALAKAKVIFDACSKVLGRRNTLTIVHGGGKTRFFRRKGGL